MTESIDPDTFHFEHLGKVQNGQGVVGALAEVVVALEFKIGQHRVPILFGLSRPVDIQSGQQADDGPSERPARQRDVVEPGKEVPRVEMIVNRLALVESLGRGQIQLSGGGELLGRPRGAGALDRQVDQAAQALEGQVRRV